MAARQLNAQVLVAASTGVEAGRAPLASRARDIN
jgi:hypothetical protein